MQSDTRFVELEVCVAGGSVSGFCLELCISGRKRRNWTCGMLLCMVYTNHIFVKMYIFNFINVSEHKFRCSDFEGRMLFDASAASSRIRAPAGKVIHVYVFTQFTTHITPLAAPPVTAGFEII